MLPMILAAVLAVSQPSSPAAAPCLGPELLHRIGRFEGWTGNDAVGWKRVSLGNGVKRAVLSNRGGYSAGFQTVFGPGSLTTHAFLPQTDAVLVAWVGGQEPHTVAIQVQDVASGRYLNVLGSWQDGPADALEQAVAGWPFLARLEFSAEGAGRTLRIEIRSNAFGVCTDGFCDCGPDLCPTGWVDDVRLCAM